MNWRWFIVIGLLLSTACAGTGRMPQGTVSRIESPKAQHLIDRLKGRNAGLSAYKGIGRIALHEKDGAWSIRSAWLGSPDGRFRVEALSLTGQPFAKMICTRRACFFLYRDGDCYRRESAGDKSLGLLSGIDVNVEDLSLLLGGGVPLADYHSARLYDTDTGEKLLILEKRFSGIVEKIYFTADLQEVKQVARYGWRGLIYRADIGERQVLQHRGMPLEVTLANAEGDTLRLSVDRFWVDVELPETVFSPDLPEGSDCDDR